MTRNVIFALCGLWLGVVLWSIATGGGYRSCQPGETPEFQSAITGWLCAD